MEVAAHETVVWHWQQVVLACAPAVLQDISLSQISDFHVMLTCALKGHFAVTLPFL